MISLGREGAVAADVDGRAWRVHPVVADGRFPTGSGDAFLAGLPSVRVIHGKGTGALRRAVEELLASHPLITSHRPGEPHEGGAGATVAELGQA